MDPPHRPLRPRLRRPVRRILSNDVLACLTRMQSAFLLGIEIHPGNDYRGSGQSAETLTWD